MRVVAGNEHSLPPPPPCPPCRRGRQTGVREETEVEEPEKLFDYVTEDEYSRIVQQRQEEGFIMDDGERGEAGRGGERESGREGGRERREEEEEEGRKGGRVGV